MTETKTITKFEEHIMELLRQANGLNPGDTSQDREINEYSVNGAYITILLGGNQKRIKLRNLNKNRRIRSIQILKTKLSMNWYPKQVGEQVVLSDYQKWNIRAVEAMGDKIFTITEMLDSCRLNTLEGKPLYHSWYVVLESE